MNLLFSIEARRQFDLVAQQFGLVCVFCREWGVRYENDKVLLKVNFDKDRSYEIGVEIGIKGARFPGPPFSLGEVLRLRGIRNVISARALIASDAVRLHDGLAQLSEYTIKYASDFLMGNDCSFAQVADLRDKESTKLWLASQLQHAGATTKVTWAARDYRAVIRALEPVEQYLSRAEKKRLEYARKQLTT